MVSVTRLWIGGFVLGAVSLFQLGMSLAEPSGAPFLLRAITFALVSVAAFLADISQKATRSR